MLYEVIMFFIISRTVGANLRLLLVADVLQTLVFEPLGIPYWVTVTATIILIWLYTFKSVITSYSIHYTKLYELEFEDTFVLLLP